MSSTETRPKECCAIILHPVLSYEKSLSGLLKPVHHAPPGVRCHSSWKKGRKEDILEDMMLKINVKTFKTEFDLVF